MRFYIPVDFVEVGNAGVLHRLPRHWRVLDLCGGHGHSAPLCRVIKTMARTLTIVRKTEGNSGVCVQLSGHDRLVAHGRG